MEFNSAKSQPQPLAKMTVLDPSNTLQTDSLVFVRLTSSTAHMLPQQAIIIFMHLRMCDRAVSLAGSSGGM